MTCSALIGVEVGVCSHMDFESILKYNNQTDLYRPIYPFLTSPKSADFVNRCVHEALQFKSAAYNSVSDAHCVLHLMCRRQNNYTEANDCRRPSRQHSLNLLPRILFLPCSFCTYHKTFLLYIKSKCSNDPHIPYLQDFFELISLP